MNDRKICVIVRDNFIYYNRQEFLTPDMPAPHAPISCLTAARGEDIKGGTAYMTELCCPECAKALGCAGIRKIVYKHERKDNNKEEIGKIAEYFDISIEKNEVIGL